MFTSSTYLAPYVALDKRLLLRDSNLNKIGGFNVCKFNKGMTEGKQVWINLEDLTMVFEFSTEADAKQALINLEVAIESLFPNCTIIGGTGGPEGGEEYTTTFTTVANTPYLITHNLNTFDFTYQVREGLSDATVDLTRINVNQVQITTTSAVTGQIKFIVF